MHKADTWGNLSKEELTARTIVRDRRLEKVDAAVVRPKNALVPRLAIVPLEKETHLTEVYRRVKADPADGPPRVKQLFLKAAMSDYDEVKERQRFVKYDNIWARAEAAFIQKKRGGGGELGGEAPA